MGDIVQCLRRGAGVSAGHVGDAIMQHAFFFIRRVIMRRRPGGFGTAALIDGDIDEDAAMRHQPEHLAGDEFRCLCPRHQHRSDDEVHPRQEVGQVCLVRIKCVGAHGDVEKAHALEIHFQDRRVRADAGGDACGVHSGGSATQDDDPPGSDARHST